MKYADIKEGAVFVFERTVSEKDVEDFARLTGDQNPLHTDEAYARQTPYKRRVAHGLLAGSLFSTLVGMHCPGRRGLYLSQTLAFHKPVFPGDRVTVKGTVVHKSDAQRVITLKTQIFVGKVEAVSGEAKVKVRED